MTGWRTLVAVVAACTMPSFASAHPHAEPLEMGENTFLQSDFMLADGTKVPLEIGRPNPTDEGARGVILFAHGANLSPDGYRVLQRRWMDAGFTVLSPTFIDSESHPAREESNRALILRNRLDVFGELAGQVQAELSGEREPALLQGLGLSQTAPIIAAGHSYGAYIAQILAGASVIDPVSGEADILALPANLRGVIALSPPPSFDGFSPRGSWSAVAVPMLSQSGPGDISPPFVSDWRQHYDGHCDVVMGDANAHSFLASYTGTDHYFGGTIGRLAEEPSAKASDDVKRFAHVSLIFVDEASKQDGDWDRVRRNVAALTDNAKIDPAFSCSPDE